MRGTDSFKVQEKFTVTELATAIGALLDGTNYQILLDSDTTKVLCPITIILKGSL